MNFLVATLEGRGSGGAKARRGELQGKGERRKEEIWEKDREREKKERGEGREKGIGGGGGGQWVVMCGWLGETIFKILEVSQ